MTLTKFQIFAAVTDVWASLQDSVDRAQGFALCRTRQDRRVRVAMRYLIVDRHDIYRWAKFKILAKFSNAEICKVFIDEKPVHLMLGVDQIFDLRVVIEAVNFKLADLTTADNGVG